MALDEKIFYREVSYAHFDTASLIINSILGCGKRITVIQTECLFTRSNMAHLKFNLI